MTGRASEHVPAEPFVRFLNERYAELAAKHAGNLAHATLALIEELGWSHQKGAERKLYRVRKSLICSSKDGRKGEFPSDRFARPLVEEALFNAGVPFSDVYPGIAASEDVELEPAAWCPHCQEERHPIDGLCAFCEWRLGPRTGQRLMGKRRAR